MSLSEIPYIDLKEHTRRLQPELNEAIDQVFRSGAFAGGQFVRAF